MTASKIKDNIECRKLVMIHDKLVPKAICLNEKTKNKILAEYYSKDGIILGLEIFIDDKMADDDFRIIRK